MLGRIARGLMGGVRQVALALAAAQVALVGGERQEMRWESRYVVLEVAACTFEVRE